MIYNAYASATRRIHGFDIVKVGPEDGYMIECQRCNERMDYAEQAEGCEDPDCPMKYWADRDAEVYGPYMEDER